MTTMKKIALGVFVVAFALFATRTAHAIGTKLFENYNSAVKYNDGLLTNLPIQTASSVTAALLSVSGTSTVSGDLTLSGTTTAATTSVKAFTQGGGVYATTTTIATETITGTVLRDYNVIRFLGSVTAAAMTATIQATSSWPSNLLPSAGDRRSWIIENGYTAAATTTTIAAGTGIDLQEPDTGDDMNVVIDINGYAWLDCFREASTDVVCLVTESSPAD